MSQNDYNSILSPTEFSQYFFYVLNTKIAEISLYSLNGLVLKTIDQSEQIFSHFLYSAYNDYKNDPIKFDEILDHYIVGSIPMYYEKEEPIVLNEILPIIKDYRFVMNSMELIENFAENHLYEKYNETLYIFYAIDGGTTINYLKRKHLKELNLSFEELRKIAIENLDASLSYISIEEDNGFYKVVTENSIDSSLILLDIWTSEKFKVDGDIIVGIPSRDNLLVTGSKDKENLNYIKKVIAIHNEKNSYVVSDDLFKYKNGTFTRWNNNTY